ncbi:TetR family transcriptional regulator [Burkholderia lata]|nr:TetR family transcriptional regulator [Burkholderia lata]
MRALDRGLGQRLRRDSARGIAARRFVVSDPFVSVLASTGTILAAIAAQLHIARTVEGGARRRAEGVGDFPERTAAIVLQTLGIVRAEAHAIANRPLPPGDFAAAGGG